MDKFGVELAMNELRENKRAWLAAKRQFDRAWTDSFIRLMHAGIEAFMSVDQMSKASGMTRRWIRAQMRHEGLDPKRSKTALSKAAAAAVQENAALLGIRPQEINLMSPLAYLPMGSAMREELATQGTVDQPLTLPVPLQELVGDFQCAWHGADKRGEVGSRSEAGVLAVLWKLGYDVDTAPTQSTMVTLSDQDTEDQGIPEGDDRVGWLSL